MSKESTPDRGDGSPDEPDPQPVAPEATVPTGQPEEERPEGELPPWTRKKAAVIARKVLKATFSLAVQIAIDLIFFA
ncbi:hypothetical protein [Saccharothrix texasensis]|uniref:Uncharacterized protein n=1 Tax=Saccharothrix texasensis TaxID=103734 RepID=A0A3N1H961_9PSEU|nr:hypothetical protein [Saccharothrix texasensis]ROP38976.1 hypothetical protein EDD40_4344 [Saccharothrix texasensis]